MSKNSLLIAAAGSGKTTRIVKDALGKKGEKVLITTYTQANELEIRKKIIEENKFIPENVVVQTWFSFLLKHGVRPFQGTLFDKKIKGFLLVNSRSGLRGYKKPCPDCKKSGVVKPCRKCHEPYYWGENDFEKYYFSTTLKIYSDKLSLFVYRCNEKTNGLVIKRMSNIFTHIFVDEVQDLAGYDLNILKLLFKSDSNVLLVGDPRQGTYSTNTSSKNKKYRKSNIVSFFEDKSFEDKKIALDKDDKTLSVNYRSNKDICILSNKIFKYFPQTSSGNCKTTGHDGVFFVKKTDIDIYLEKYSPVQLRDSSRTKNVNENYNVMNFGESKGLSFDRVLIYPTKPFLAWLEDNNNELAETSRAKLYVAITRARYSIGIVVENNKYDVGGIQYWSIHDHNL
jgi:superfamily I DNA/RNA helicase